MGDTDTKTPAQILTDEGIPFESKHNGACLAVNSKHGLISFWPSTGAFVTDRGFKGRGIFNLMKLCDKQPPTTKEINDDA